MDHRGEREFFANARDLKLGWHRSAMVITVYLHNLLSNAVYWKDIASFYNIVVNM